MFDKINIALAVPSSKGVNRYISLSLKKELRNERSEYDLPPRILALSDIEGNYIAFRRLLLKNGVINNKYEWTFKEGHLVIVGDCFDRGEEVIECLWLIYSLEDKARAAGGYVHFILGNHEIMNMNGDWRYVHPKYAVRNPVSKRNGTALYDANNELWRWLHTKNIMERIGNLLFVHGGISQELVNLKLTVSEINELVRPYYSSANEQFTDKLLHCVFNTASSPFWYRGYYQSETDETLIDTTLAQFKCNTIVTGHTVVQHITSFFNGKVINVDTDHASGNSEVLLIKKQRFYRVNNNGTSERLK